MHVLKKQTPLNKVSLFLYICKKCLDPLLGLFGTFIASQLEDLFFSDLLKKLFSFKNHTKEDIWHTLITKVSLVFAFIITLIINIQI